LNLADAFVEQRELALASELLQGVHRLVRDPAVSEWMKWRYSMHLFASAGELAFARDDHREARAFADQCLEVASRTGSRKYEARAWRLRGEIAIARRQWGDAAMALHEALGGAHGVGNPTQLWKTHVALARLHMERGEITEAEAARTAAHAVVAAVSNAVHDAELRRNLDAMLARAIAS
jgi:hypothetical protein